MTGAGAKPYTRIERVLAVVLLVVVILVSGLVVRTVTAVGDSSRLYTDVEPGQTVAIGGDTTAAAVGITVASTLADRDRLIASAGRYVMVEYELTAGREKAPSVTVELLVGDRSYRPIDDTLEPLPPGFSGRRVALFEVPTDALPDVVVVMGRNAIVHSTEAWLRWDPGLTEDDIEGSATTSLTLPEPTVEVAR